MESDEGGFEERDALSRRSQRAQPQRPAQAHLHPHHHPLYGGGGGAFMPHSAIPPQPLYQHHQSGPHPYNPQQFPPVLPVVIPAFRHGHTLPRAAAAAADGTAPPLPVDKRRVPGLQAEPAAPGRWRADQVGHVTEEVPAVSSTSGPALQLVDRRWSHLKQTQVSC